MVANNFVWFLSLGFLLAVATTAVQINNLKTLFSGGFKTLLTWGDENNPNAKQAAGAVAKSTGKKLLVGLLVAVGCYFAAIILLLTGFIGMVVSLTKS